MGDRATVVTMILPTYEPPSDRRASVAVGLAPVFVLVVFALIVSGLIAFDIGFAIFLACTVWVIYEMHDYQRAIDDYDRQYVDSHLVWRSSEALEAMAGAQDVEPETSDFVRRFIGAGRTLQPEQPRL
jgi:hypothetical protein